MRTLSSSSQPIKPLFRWKDACHRTQVLLLPGSIKEDESSWHVVTPRPILRPAVSPAVFALYLAEITGRKKSASPQDLTTEADMISMTGHEHLKDVSEARSPGPRNDVLWQEKGDTHDLTGNDDLSGLSTSFPDHPNKVHSAREPACIQR